MGLPLPCVMSYSSWYYLKGRTRNNSKTRQHRLKHARPKEGVSSVILERFSISQEDLFFFFITVLLCYSPCAIVFDALCFKLGIPVGKFTEEASQLVKFQSLLLPSSLFVWDARFHVVPSARVQFSMYHIKKALDTASMFANKVPKTCTVAATLTAVSAMLVYNHYLQNSSPAMAFYLDDVNLTQIADLSGIRSTSLKGPETTILPYAILPGQEKFIVFSLQLLFSSWQANQDNISSRSIKFYQLAVPWAERLLYHFSSAMVYQTNYQFSASCATVSLRVVHKTAFLL